MYKIDLHTHSTASYDGGINSSQYQHILDSKKLDFIAITDHNKIEQAVQIQQKLGNKVIVGEEIKTTEGEIIGLFLTKKVQANLSALQTVKAIKEQGGLVYIPHPFETIRSGITPNTLEKIFKFIDIIEAYNGRAIFQNKSSQALEFAKKYKLASSASSDAHGIKGLAHTYTLINKIPTLKNLASQLSEGQMVFKKPPLTSLLNPKANRIKKVFGK